MNITFLIGNGFDKNVGLNCLFPEIRKQYTSDIDDLVIQDTDTPITKFKKSIKAENEYWSNFEFALGEYTSEFDDDEDSDFSSCILDFVTFLVDYLQAEEKKIDYSKCIDEIKQVFSSSIKDIWGNLSRSDQNVIKNIITKWTENVNYRFISFNYTHVLDKCLELSFDNDNAVGNHSRGSTGFSHRVNKNVVHVHGELPGPIIMGVDNAQQVGNKKWATKKRFLQKIVKSKSNARYGSLNDAAAKDIIGSSGIICIFGMSIGETDKIWWKQIGVWLNDDNHRLIIFAHESSVPYIFIPSQQFEIEDNVRDRFMDMAEIETNRRDAIEDRILVVVNSDFLKVNLIELSRDKSVESAETELLSV